MQTIIGTSIDTGLTFGDIDHINIYPNVLKIWSIDCTIQYTKLHIKDVLSNNLLYFSSW